MRFQIAKSNRLRVMSDKRLQRVFDELRLRFHMRLAARQGLVADEIWVRSRLGEMNDRSLARAITLRFGDASGLRSFLGRIWLWRWQ